MIKSVSYEKYSKNYFIQLQINQNNMKRRKKYLTIVLSLVCVIGLQAQTLDVKSFAVKANDNTARTQPRQDFNNDYCAMVNVHLAASGVIFEENRANFNQNRTRHINSSKTR